MALNGVAYPAQSGSAAPASVAGQVFQALLSPFA